jgi:hypothetical protein
MVVACTLLADTLTVTKTSFLGPNGHGRVTIRKEYKQGDKSRIDSEVFSSDSAARPVVNITFSDKVQYILDPSLRQYVEYPIPPVPANRPYPVPSPFHANVSDQLRKTLDIYFEVTDTGERRQFFGQTARHLVWRDRRVAEPGACGTSSTMEADGWYYAEPEQEAGVTKMAILTGGFMTPGGRPCIDNIVVHGRRPRGFAVLEETNSLRTEILELSHDPLDKSLFEIPSGYSKVENLAIFQNPPLTWSQQLERGWAQVVREIEFWLR